MRSLCEIGGYCFGHDIFPQKKNTEAPQHLSINTQLSNCLLEMVCICSQGISFTHLKDDSHEYNICQMMILLMYSQKGMLFTKKNQLHHLQKSYYWPNIRYQNQYFHQLSVEKNKIRSCFLHVYCDFELTSFLEICFSKKLGTACLAICMIQNMPSS